MDPSALIVMTLSVGSVLLLVSYCLIRVMTLPPVEEDDYSESL